MHDGFQPDHKAAAIHRARAERAYQDAERFRKLKRPSGERAALEEARTQDRIAELLETGR